MSAVLPEKAADEIVRILRMGNTTFSNFISGQVLEAFILGMMFVVAMSIFRMPYVLLVSVIISVTALIPIVGAFAGCIIGGFFILVNDPIQAFWFVILFLVLAADFYTRFRVVLVKKGGSDNGNG